MKSFDKANQRTEELCEPGSQWETANNPRQKL